jgi:single-stranded-DNA-specific exonuclease
MSIGVQCLLAESDAEAAQLAAQLDALNRERREIETRMRQDAMQIVDRLDLLAESNAASVLCLIQRDWHEGLVGLIASRVKDRVHLPTFAFAPTGDGELKGSGRSVPGFHLRDALALVDARHPGLIARFGGHAMAAGLTIRHSDLESFAAAIDLVGAAQLTAEQRMRRILTDGELAVEHLEASVADLLHSAGPWGQAFPEPLFEGTFRVVDWRLLKDAHLKMTLQVGGAAKRVEAIAFNSERKSLSSGEALRLAYRLQTNDYFAERRTQLVVEHMEPADGHK